MGPMASVIPVILVPSGVGGDRAYTTHHWNAMFRAENEVCSQHERAYPTALPQRIVIRFT